MDSFHRLFITYMKNVLRISILSWVALGSVLSANIIDPLGGMVIPIKGNSDTRISIPFSRPVVFEARIQSYAGNQITAPGAPGWADNQFVYGDADSLDTTHTYYLVFLSGVNEGLALPITANTADTVTVNLGSESLSGVTSESVNGTGNGDIFQIVPCWTPATLFAGATVPDRTLLYRYSGSGNRTNRSPEPPLTYFSGSGWFDHLGTLSDDVPLNLAEAMVLRTPASSSDFNITVGGGVPMFKVRAVFATDSSGTANDTLFSIYSPLEVSVGASNIGVVGDRAILYIYDNNLVETNKSPTQVITYFDGFGWYDRDANLVDNSFFLQPGTSYVLRKPGTQVVDAVMWSYLPSHLE